MNGKLVIALCLLAAAITAALFLGLPFATQKREPMATQRRDPITITVGVSIAKMDLNDLTAKSDAIVVGQVGAIAPSRWNTIDGKLPPGTTVKNISRSWIIFTDADLRIRQTIKGDIRQAVMRVRTFGGQVGQDRMIVEGEPSLEAGQMYLLFLVHDTGTTASITPGHYLILGSLANVYEISGDNAISVSDRWVLGALVSQIQKSLFAATLSATATIMSGEPVTQTPLPATVVVVPTGTLPPLSEASPTP